MRGISVKQAAAIVGGKLSGKGNVERELRGLVIDSRLVEPDFAFAAIMLARRLSLVRHAASSSAIYPMRRAA